MAWGYLVLRVVRSDRRAVRCSEVRVSAGWPLASRPPT